MPKAISAERWAAARALMRLEPPTQSRVAAAMGINLTTLASRTARGGWIVLDYRRADVVAAHKELYERLMARFVRGAVDPPVAVETLAMDAINQVTPPGGELGAVGPETGSGEASQAGAGPAVSTGDARTGEGRAGRVAAMLMKHADRLIEQVERQGGVLTKPQLDALLAMVRLAEKFEPMAQREQAFKEVKSEDDVAEIHDRINRRILQLAKAHARRLVSGTYFGGACSVCGK